MGFLRRALGGGGTRQLSLNATYFKRLRDDAVVHVVGEAYRQHNVSMARPPGPQDLPPGLPPPPAGFYKAMLIPEPSNQYDRNAIAAHLWSGGTWTMVGYLARPDAAAYQPVFSYLSRTADPSATPTIACDAALISEYGGTGVVLHLGTPAECVAELVTDDRTPIQAHPWVGKVVSFTGALSTTVFGVPLDRPAQIMLARWAGCEVSPRVTKKTNTLVIAGEAEPSAGLVKAREYGIPTCREVEFLQIIGIPMDAIGRSAGRWARG